MKETMRRALCLHSFRTNGEIMRMQMQLACHEFFPNVEFDFMEGIHICSAAEQEKIPLGLRNYFPVEKFGPYREWWNAVDGVYDRYEETIEAVEERLSTGSYDGIVGFSQGGVVAATVLALQMSRGHDGPLRWAWLQSAFLPRHPAANQLFQDLKGHSTKVLVTTHDGDPIVTADKSSALADALEATYIAFPGRAHKLVSLSDATNQHVMQVKSFFEDLSSSPLEDNNNKEDSS